MPDTVIEVQNLSKLYELGTIGGRTLRESLERGWYRLRGKEHLLHKVGAKHRMIGPDHPQAGPRPNTMWALKDVSFSVREGEVLGIVGRNGAGKSTLLKILTRITEPTSGRASIYGRVASLLEVGTGFHPELTGRENIYLNGAILGMKRAEIDRRFDEIVAFAEIESYLDTPVKRYSSGMYVRLAFAVAAHLEPEILLIDEVLAVGDIAFQKKCLGKMEDVAKGGRTVFFVSHNMQAVRALCPRSLLIEGGRVALDGLTADTVNAYYEAAKRTEVGHDTAVHDEQKRRGSGAVRFTRIEVQDAGGTKCSEFDMGDEIRLVLDYETFNPIPNLYVAVLLRSGMSGETVTSVRHPVHDKGLTPGMRGSVTIDLPEANLRPGVYRTYFWLGNRLAQPYDVVDDLTVPLTIHAKGSVEELGFDPASPSGFFNIESRLTDCSISPR